MAALVTLAQLRTRSRLYADERPGGTDAYISDASANDLINQSLKELYDKLVAARGHDYYINADTITTVAGTESYALPADFYELYSVEIHWSPTDVEPVDDFQIQNRVKRFSGLTWGRWSPKGYRVFGSNIAFVPIPNNVVDIEIIYLPAATELALDADTFDGVNGWEKSVCLRTAIEMRTIQQEDTSDLERLYERELARIDSLAADRAASAPKRVVDVFPESPMRRWPERLPRP